MTDTLPPPIELPKDWEVPAFRIEHWHGRRNSYCVVIPVINEGERIARLLARMSALAISKKTDILIIDGGSTDGSLPASLLRECDVSALLIKTGPGKLSAQLRCAYAFALTQGYEGIVTIDGNDKDDPEAIPQFIAAMEEGVDFVQASRFVAGGIAENTPWVRDIAIRYLHAPLISRVAGFRWTDTTQGFRAYRRALLLDPRIAPFRSVFMTYELLAYLSCRAPKLGYRCLELPTTRRYPPGEVPTKISSVRGNLAVLRILVKASLGYYDPPASENP
jgi:dolichol-phosphate mannosyltransferase